MKQKVLPQQVIFPTNGIKRKISWVCRNATWLIENDLKLLTQHDIKRKATNIRLSWSLETGLLQKQTPETWNQSNEQQQKRIKSCSKMFPGLHQFWLQNKTKPLPAVASACFQKRMFPNNESRVLENNLQVEGPWWKSEVSRNLKCHRNKTQIWITPPIFRTAESLLEPWGCWNQCSYYWMMMGVTLKPSLRITS